MRMTEEQARKRLGSPKNLCNIMGTQTKWLSSSSVPASRITPAESASCSGDSKPEPSHADEDEEWLSRGVPPRHWPRG
jgi:hypothetical protein